MTEHGHVVFCVRNLSAVKTAASAAPGLAAAPAPSRRDPR